MGKIKTANKEFNKSILPESGQYCVFELDGKQKPRHKWFDNKEDAIKYVQNNRHGANQLFIALATFNKQGSKSPGRKQEHARSLRVFFFDIDCGKGKPYATQKEGKKALKAFCKRTNLPRPTIVSSGNGIHAYWKLSTEIDADTWMKEARKLKRLVSAIEPDLDKDGIITDSARVLRPVGSFNKKDPNNHKEVTLIKDCGTIKFSEFKKILDCAVASLPTEQEPNNEGNKGVEKTINKGNYSAIKISTYCPFINKIRETRGDVNEPEWHATIGVLRHCDESPEIIHEWSKGHPNYTRKETNAKISHHDKPPTTCLYFAKISPDICKGCKHYGLIKSPIALGFIRSSDENIPEYIKEFNRYYFVSDISGKTAVCRETYDDALKTKVLVLSSFTDFRNLYNNNVVQVGSKGGGEPITTPIGNAWLNHPNRRQYDGIKLLPEGAPDRVYNLWRGFTVEAIEGSWPLMRRHIRKIICNSDKKAYDYVIKWLARMVQKPWKVGEVALVLQGDKGVGKSIIVSALCKIVGQNSMQITNS